MHKLLCGMLLFSTLAQAEVTMVEANQIYKRLTDSNRIYAPKLYLIPVTEDNAYTYFKTDSKGIKAVAIGITSEALFANNKDQIAGLLSHELGHATKGGNETEADMTGREYLHRAGYNACVARWWFAKRNHPAIGTYQSSQKRYKIWSKYCTSK